MVDNLPESKLILHGEICRAFSAVEVPGPNKLLNIQGFIFRV
jgi:hypothetical protein